MLLFLIISYPESILSAENNQNSASTGESQAHNSDSSSDVGSENNTGSSAELPDLEFLEFLGSWETDSGEWVDPTLFLEEEMQELLESAQAPNSEVETD